MNPLTILKVIPDTTDSEKVILKTKQELEKFVEETTASDTQASIITTIDLNVVSGISRIAKEVMADIIILGWPQRKRFLDKLAGIPVGNIFRRSRFLSNLIGSKTESFLEETLKTVFVCSILSPLINHTKLFLIVPDSAEFEEGFPIWLNKVAKLSIELSIPISLNCTERTHTAILKFAKANKLSLTIEYAQFDDWTDLLTMSRKIEKTDFIIMVSARSGYISHTRQLDSVPSRLEEHFTDMNKMVIYPQ